MKKLLIATKNPGKLAKSNGFSKTAPVELVSLTDVGITDSVEETGRRLKKTQYLRPSFMQKIGFLRHLQTTADSKSMH